MRRLLIALISVLLIASPVLAAEGDVRVIVQRQQGGQWVEQTRYTVPASKPTATPKPTTTPTPAPTPTPTPAPTPTPTPAPTPAPTPSPTPTPTPPPANADIQWIEAQQWWNGPIGGGAPDDVDFPFRHVHMAVGIPTKPVSGIVTVPFIAQTHGNTGRLNLVKWQDDDGGQSQTVIIHPPEEIGPDDVYEGEFSIDTRNEKDGLRLWRFYAQWVHPNGNLQVARPRFVVEVDNGKADTNVKTASEGGTGWYKEEKPSRDWGYSRAALSYADRIKLSQPKCGVWKPTLNIDLNDKGEGPALDGWSVHLDPRFHDGAIGRVVAEGKGPIRDQVTIDLAGLSNGQHRLVIRAVQDDGGKRAEGVTAYPFIVGC